MWPARGGARAGSGRGGRCLDVLSGLKVGSGRPASATGSHLAPDTSRRVNVATSTRERADRARDTAGRATIQAPRRQAASGRTAPKDHLGARERGAVRFPHAARVLHQLAEQAQ
eukprot:scaffold18316_cov119-Isochrysis_galbana.AAC.1